MCSLIKKYLITDTYGNTWILTPNMQSDLYLHMHGFVGAEGKLFHLVGRIAC